MRMSVSPLVSPEARDGAASSRLPSATPAPAAPAVRINDARVSVRSAMSVMGPPYGGGRWDRPTACSGTLRGGAGIGSPGRRGGLAAALLQPQLDESVPCPGLERCRLLGDQLVEGLAAVAGFGGDGERLSQPQPGDGDLIGRHDRQPTTGGRPRCPERRRIPPTGFEPVLPP